MLRQALVTVLAAVIVTGCNHADDSTRAGGAGAHKKIEKPVDPAEATRAGMHEGAFQLGDAADDLQTAVTAAKALQTSTKNLELKAALVVLLDKLDDAGGSISDFTGAPPELTEFKKEIDDQDKKRLDAIDAANDAVHDINDCNDILDDFNDKPAPEDDQAISDLSDALDAAAGDLADAIKAFGGHVEKNDTETVPTPDSGSTSGTSPDKKGTVRPDI